ncbi:N-acyl homoserine lactonase AttM [Deinococcus xinjiangensis]|uniref:N-acyl homoserine lactonase AttM n=1 Tax=Deinococcus xinjiangensis TaxID=457454 RepID=A0ABP9VGQ2_9DEIO
MKPLPISGFTIGHIQVKTQFLRPEPQNILGSLKALRDKEFLPPVPVWCWVIEHPLGIVVVDTGQDELARSNWFGRTQTRIHYRPADRLAAQMMRAGVDPAQVRTLIFTHLHIDHDRGAGDFPEALLLASSTEIRQYTSPFAALLGYSPPVWAKPPQEVSFGGPALGPFAVSHDVYGDQRIMLLPTSGHTAGHLSVLIRQPEVDVLLAGDLTYTQQDLLTGRLGGFLTAPASQRQAMEKVRQLASAKPLIYLPSHDPESLTRLQNAETLPLA